jgi:hypothetical protein
MYKALKMWVGARRCAPAWCCLAVALVFGACTSDRETPVGSELADDILGNRPGPVFTDSAVVFNDRVDTLYTLIDRDSRIEVGRDNGYERVMLLRPDFSNAGTDTNRVVEEAFLRVVIDSETSDVPVLTRFYELASPFEEGDSVRTLDTLRVLTDPGTGGAQRVMNLATARYELDSLVVQQWIRSESPNNGIAVVYDDPANDKVGVFKSREDGADPATLQVNFTDGSSTGYKISDDGTFARPVQGTSNLVVSDGFQRRVRLDLDLGILSDSAAVHNAALRLHIVPDTDLGRNLRVVLVLSDSTGVTGSVITDRFVNVDRGFVQFSGVNLTLALLALLEEQVDDYGLIIRMDQERTELRQVEFYPSSAADSLRPRLYVTGSDPAEFDR